MDLEVPVLARNIPGNSAVVEHGVTGLLFSNPQVKRVLSPCPFLIGVSSVCVKNVHEFGVPDGGRAVQHALWILFSP